MTQESSLFPDTDVAVETTAASGRFAEIVFDRPLDHAYTYAIPEGFAVDPGQRVLVPFGQGNRPTVGFCVGISEEAPSRAVKSLLQVLDPEPIVTPNLMKLTRWMADYYVAGWGQVLNGVVPAGAKAGAGTRTVALIEPMPMSLRRDPAPTLSPKQQAALTILDKAGHAMEIAELARQVGCGPGPIRGLIDKGLGLRKVGRIETPATFDESTSASPSIEPAVAPPLTPDQQAVWDGLLPALREGGFHAHLLYGVTGSGKTELYLRAIEEVVRQGKEALVLVPEISLTPQTIRAFRGRCGDVAVLHSHLQEAQRGGHWRRIANGHVQVVVGARSAIFAPTRRLGLIVIDEEHEPSFKQETTPRSTMAGTSPGSCGPGSRTSRSCSAPRRRRSKAGTTLAARGQYRLHELPKPGPRSADAARPSHRSSPTIGIPTSGCTACRPDKPGAAKRCALARRRRPGDSLPQSPRLLDEPALSLVAAMSRCASLCDLALSPSTRSGTSRSATTAATRNSRSTSAPSAPLRRSATTAWGPRSSKARSRRSSRARKFGGWTLTR